MSSEEPLYCPFCGAEDFGCPCPMPEGPDDTRKVLFCELCGAKMPCAECDAFQGLPSRPVGDPL